MSDERRDNILFLSGECDFSSGLVVTSH